MARPEATSAVDISALSPKEIIDRGLRVKRDEEIDIDSIVTDVSIVDQEHASELGDSIKNSGRGQLLQIGVRARLSKGKVVYDVFDGFHRTEGMRANGLQKINAKVVYGCSDQELIDLRILAASSITSVQYPRLGVWITDAFAQTPWAKEQGVTVTQAFAIAVRDSKKLKDEKLPRETLEAIRDWVQEKCGYWKRGVRDTYTIVRIVSNADPDIIKKVRVVGGGRKRVRGYNPERLAPVIIKFPGKDNYHIQNTLMENASEFGLTGAETLGFVDAVAALLEGGTEFDEINFVEIFRQIAKDSVPTSLPIEGPTMEDLAVIDRLGGVGMSEDLSDTEIAGESESVLEFEDFLDERLEDEPEIRDSYGFAPDYSSVRNLGMVGTTPDGKVNAQGDEEIGGRMPPLSQHSDIEAANREITQLRRSLEEAQGMLKDKSAASSDWWSTAPYLTMAEREVMTLLFTEVLDFDLVSSRMQIGRMEIVLMAQSAFKKRYLEHFRPKHKEKLPGEKSKKNKSA